MLSDYHANRITESLLGMAQANWHEFSISPKLCALYAKNMADGRHTYISDKITCGFADCWSSYRGLAERYPKGPVYLDCEDAATAHAGWLASQRYTLGEPIYVGLVPGKRISHAIAGVGTNPLATRPEDDTIRIVDPSRWYGMAPTSYDKVFWRRVELPCDVERR